jgi:hypothetical protein
MQPITLRIWQGGGGIRISMMLPDEIVEDAQLVVREELPDGTLRVLEPLFNTGIENRGRFFLFQSSFCRLDEPRSPRGWCLKLQAPASN